MKKKVISILLTIVMLIGIIPLSVIAVFAEGSAVPIGNQGLLTANLNTESAATVNFGTDGNGAPVEFRVIGDENGGATSPADCLTLISNGFVVPEQAFSNESSNEYAGSALQAAVNGSITLSDTEKSAVQPRTLAGGKNVGTNCDGVAGATVENALLWAPTVKDANLINENLRKSSFEWWLCSPGYHSYDAAYVRVNARVDYMGADVIENLFAVRSAFYLDLSSVLLVSSANDGKAAAKAGGSAIPFIVTDSGALKLTVKDASRQFAITGSDGIGKKVRITYTGAETGENEFISYYVLDANGAVKSYAKIAKSESANGSAEFERPELESGETLYIINEQANSDGKTDFASAPVAFELPCEHICSTDRYRDNGDGTHSQKCDKCGKYFNAQAHSFASGVYRNNGDGTHSQKCINCDAYSSPAAHDFTGVMYHNNGDGTHIRQCVCGETYGEASEHNFASGIYRCNDDGTYSQRCLLCDEYTAASAENWNNISYYGYDTGTNAFTLQSTAAFTEVTDSVTVWNSGCYLVKNDVTVNSRIQVNGNVKLILVNGADLTVKGGIGVAQNASLNIYAQSLSTADMGTVTVSDVENSNAGIGGDYASVGGSVTIHGGVFNVTGGASGAGIGSGESETEDYDFETYIINEASCGDITIYGGVIVAQGGRNAAGIGGGLSASCGNINIIGGCIKSSGGAYSYSAIGLGREGVSIGTVTYPEGQEPYNYDNITYVGCVPVFGKYADCTESGWRDAFKNLTNGLYYSSMIFTADTLIGDRAALDEWTTKGEGFLPALGHNYQPYNVGGHNHRCSNCGDTEGHTDNDEDGFCDGCKTAMYCYFSEITGQYEISSVDWYCTEYKGETELEFGEWNGWYFVGENYTVNERIVVKDHVNLVLVNGVELKAMKGITVGKGASLTVYASTTDESKMGKLTVPGAPDDCAGIGGAVGITCGNMIFHGGNFDIKAGTHGAAIGAGKDGYSEEKEDFWTGQKTTEYYPVNISDCGSVTVYGGVFNLSGNGCGIGCSTYISSLNSITINGGTFTSVRGSTGCAAIGAGDDHSECGNITINGGVFKEIRSNYRGSGIGGGAASSCGNITVNDCAIYLVSGGTNGTGIGAGHSSSCGNITINGGVMNVEGGTFGQFGIGSLNSCGDIRINGGVIKAFGHQYFDTYGSGPNGEGIGTRDTSASIIYADGLFHKSIADGYNGYEFVNFEPVSGKNAGCEYPGYKSCYYNHFDGLYYTDFGEPDKCLIGNEAALEKWRAEGGGGYIPPTGKSHRWNYSNEFIHYCGYCGVAANHADNNNDGKCDDCGIEKYYYRNTAEAKFEVAYLPVAPTNLTSSTRTLNKSWYTVSGNVTVDGRITVSGNVNLLLKDGAELTVKGGIGIADTASLTIYAQSVDSAKIGKLTVSNVDDFNAGIGGSGSGSTCGDIIIHGGILNVKGGDYSAGIGTGDAGKCGNIKIYGGVIYADGSDFGAAIGGGRACSAGNVAINGGYIIATAKQSSPVAIGAGVEGSGIEVSYGDGVFHKDDGLITYVNFEPCDGLAPTCLEAGYKESFKNPSADEYYSALPFSEAVFIGNSTKLEEWQTSGDGVISPHGHNFVNTDEKNHTCSYCGEVQAHTDTDGDGKCDDCKAVLYYDYIEETKSYEMKAVPANATVLTGTLDTEHYYYDEWYIIHGNVTANGMITFIVREKNQSTHIILENGALFTANNGIRVCNKTTFYASTTDESNESKMGKLYVPSTRSYNAGIGNSWIGYNPPHIIIDGGRYDITAGDCAAAIGGGMDAMGGSITINGGRFDKLCGGYGGAAIGNGEDAHYERGGDITINGGTFIDIRSSEEGGGAAIGSGGDRYKNNGVVSNIGNITITGGYFEHIWGGRFAAAIGSGAASTCGNITITGGTFNSIIGSFPYSPYTGEFVKSGAGIGSGWSGKCGDITITGGRFEIITTRPYGAAIGTGSHGASCGTITIGGGYLNRVCGGEHGAAVGSGYSAEPVTIRLTGGIMHSTGGGDPTMIHTATAAIGKGDYSQNATVIISEGMEARDFADGLPGVVVDSAALKNKEFVLVCPGNMPETVFCTEAGHKAYYTDVSGVLYYRYDYPTGQTLSGDIEQWRAWKQYGYSEFTWKLDEDIKYYTDAEHTKLIGGYTDLTAWLNTPAESGGGMLPAIGHSWKCFDNKYHKCERCNETEEHTDDGTGICEICAGKISYIFSAKNGAVINNGLIYGLEPRLESLDNFIEVSEGYTLEYDSPVGTGTVVKAVKDSEVYENLTVVIFGDVNNDGVYDGMDAMIVNCLANGMLTREQVGEAVYMAADCNHDGVIDEFDVELLEEAGVLLASVDQSKTQEELQTDSVYVEYLNLIDQNPVNEETEKEQTPSALDKLIGFIADIYAFLNNLINFIKTIFA